MATENSAHANPTCKPQRPLGTGPSTKRRRNAPRRSDDSPTAMKIDDAANRAYAENAA